MIINPSYFRKYFQNDAESRLVSKLVDEWFKENGMVMWGEYDTNGDAHKFSSYKELTDSHVVLALKPQEMGDESPRSAPIQSTEITNDDLQKAKEAFEERIDRKLQTLQALENRAARHGK